MAGGRKLVGSAQRRMGSVLLQHGSLPLEDDQSAVASFVLPGSGGGTAEEGGAPATLAALLGRVPAWEELAAAIAAGWEESLGVRLAADALSPEEEERARAAAERYAGAAWTWHL
jgi:lipoate-protein ligase A